MNHKKLLSFVIAVSMLSSASMAGMSSAIKTVKSKIHVLGCLLSNKSLWKAAETGDLDYLQWFFDVYLEYIQWFFDVDEGITVDSKDEGGYSLLHRTAMNGHLKIVNWLITKGARVDQKDNFGYTSLHLAAQGGHLDVVKYLIAKGAQVDTQNQDDWTPLHYAAFNGHHEVVKYLVRIGARVDKKDNEGNTPLLTAANENCANIIKHIFFSKTPCYGPLWDSHCEVAKVLLEQLLLQPQGAYKVLELLAIKNRENRTALAVAHEEIAELITAFENRAKKMVANEKAFQANLFKNLITQQKADLIFSDGYFCQN